MKNPCYQNGDCIQRRVGCHSCCKEYLLFFEEQKKKKEKQYKENETRNTVESLHLSRRSHRKKKYCV
nr:MAG TPA: hypothetical protein [Caudoviricetes sp.]